MADNGPLIDDSERWVRVDNKHSYSSRVEIYLPHSCDEWLIGESADAWRLIRDLQWAIEKRDALPVPD